MIEPGVIKRLRNPESLLIVYLPGEDFDEGWELGSPQEALELLRAALSEHPGDLRLITSIRERLQEPQDLPAPQIPSDEELDRMKESTETTNENRREPE